MKKIMFVSVLVLALLLVYTAGESMACGMMKDKARVSKFLGTAVKDSEGQDLGAIIDFMKDPSSGAAFAVIAYGADDEYGEGGRMVAVPFSLFSCAEQDCTLNVARDGLDFAPTFTSKEDFAEQKMAWDVYRYFGLHPYWTDEGTDKAEMAPDAPAGFFDY